MSELNNDQRRAVECSTHCLVVACPGSGKTSTIVAKIGAILQADPKNTVCAVTFTRDSAEELRERIKLATPDADRRSMVGTFHALCGDQLRRAGQRLRIADGVDLRRFVFRAMQQTNCDDFEQTLKQLENIKCSIEYAMGTHEHSALLKIYQQQLDRHGLLDYQDLMAYSFRGMRDGTVKPVPCTHMLVDEFQDTDAVQYAWVREHIDRGVVVTVVGDDDQCIYAFRRALGYDGMVQFQTDTSAELITLGINYRSRFEIVDAATRLIQHNPNRVPKSIHSFKGAGGVISHSVIYPIHEDEKTLSREAEVTRVIDSIQQYVCTVSDGALPYRYSAKTGKLAILARRNYDLDLFELELARRRIRYYRNKGSVWNSEYVVYFLNLLKAVEKDHPLGIDAALHINDIGYTDVQLLHDTLQDTLCLRMRSAVPIEIVDMTPGALLSINALREEMHRWRTGYERMRKSENSDGRANIFIGGVASWIIRRLEEADGYRDPSTDLEGKGSKHYYSKLQVEYVRDILQRNLKGSISQRIELLKNPKGPTDDPDRGVGMYTMHGCKGLEFDNVWIVSSEQAVIPDSAIKKAIDSGDRHDGIVWDERRLFYVAMTRARERLFMTCLEGRESQFVVESGAPTISMS